jgi:hypothetical protein
MSNMAGLWTSFAAAYGDETPVPRAVEVVRPQVAPTAAIATAFLLKSINVLESIVEQETAALRENAPVDMKEFNARKSQALVELNRAVKPFEGKPLDERLASSLRRLRDKLELNRQVLRQHVEAVREISTMLCDAIRDLESDGTYSRGHGYGS